MKLSVWFTIGCRKLHFSSVGCRVPKKFGNHCVKPLLYYVDNKEMVCVNDLRYAFTGTKYKITTTVNIAQSGNAIACL